MVPCSSMRVGCGVRVQARLSRCLFGGLATTRGHHPRSEARQKSPPRPNWSDSPNSQSNFQIFTREHTDEAFFDKKEKKRLSPRSGLRGFQKSEYRSPKTKNKKSDEFHRLNHIKYSLSVDLLSTKNVFELISGSGFVGL